jgi:hypothetical protein
MASNKKTTKATAKKPAAKTVKAPAPVVEQGAETASQ